jgi:hypothetical protein
MSSGNVTGSKTGLSIGGKVRSGIDFFCDGEKKSITFAVKDLGVLLFLNRDQKTCERDVIFIRSSGPINRKIVEQSAFWT